MPSIDADWRECSHVVSGPLLYITVKASFPGGTESYSHVAYNSFSHLFSSLQGVHSFILFHRWRCVMLQCILCRIQRFQAQLNRGIEDKTLQQQKLLETQETADLVETELRTAQEAISPLEVEVDNLAFLSQDLCEMSGGSGHVQETVTKFCKTVACGNRCMW